MSRLRLTTLLVMTAVVAGCDVSSFIPGPRITGEMVTNLDGQGLRLREADPRTGDLAPDAAVAIVREELKRDPSTPFYVEVFCIDRKALGCVSWRGFMGEPNETEGVWVMTFPGVSGLFGGAWVGVDATTGEIVLGDWDTG